MTNAGRHRDHLVWVYGSLLCTPTLMAALAPRLDEPTTSVQVVTGWRRSWNCLSSKTFLTTAGERVRRIVAGLEPAPEAATHGVLLHVGERDMALLRRREAAYDEVDVTACLDDAPGRVITFVPKPARVRTAAHRDLPLVVEREYYDTCLRGATAYRLDHAAAELRATLDVRLAEVAGGVRFSDPA